MTRTKDEITTEIAVLAKRQRLWSGISSLFWLVSVAWLILRWTHSPITELLWANLVLVAIILVALFPLTKSLVISRTILRLNRERDAAPKAPLA